MSFDPEYLVALDRTQAVDLFKDLTVRQYKSVDLSIYTIPGNATIRPNQSATSADDFGIFAFYVDGLGVHVSTMLSKAAYERLFAMSTPNELQTRYFLTPEGQIDEAWICVSRSDTSVGEIFDIEFSFEIDVPMPTRQNADAHGLRNREPYGRHDRPASALRAASAAVFHPERCLQQGWLVRRLSWCSTSF